MEIAGTECQEEVFHTASDLRRQKNVLPSTTKKAVIQRPGTTPHGLLLGYMAEVLKRVEEEVRESAEIWYEIDFITTTPDTCEEIRRKLNWMTLEKRGVMARLCMMHRCVLKEYSMKSLGKRIQFNTNGTRGVGKLFLPRPQTDFFKKFIHFQGNPRLEPLAI